jgi:hypothetical protein
MKKQIIVIALIVMLSLIMTTTIVSGWYTSRLTTDKDSYIEGDTVYVTYEVDCGEVSDIDYISAWAKYQSGINYAYDEYLYLNPIDYNKWGKNFTFELNDSGELEIVVIAFDFEGRAIAEARKTISAEEKTCKITVYVTDTDDNPLSNVQVLLSGEKITGLDGMVVFSVPWKSSYMVVVSKDGYVLQRNDNLLVNEDITLHFSLVKEDTDTKDSSDSVSGFELFFIFCAVVFLLLLKRKNT